MPKRTPVSEQCRPRALVTGASRGIGAAVAVELALAGYPVILNYRQDLDGAEAVKARIEMRGGQAELAGFDVTDADTTGAAIVRLLEDSRPIGVLVNNAGITRDAAFPAMEPDAWGAVLDATLSGFYNVTRPLVMPMVRQRWGRIISMSSVSALVGNRGQVNYAAAKAGIIGASKSLALELAKRKITVNVVAPGLIETDMTSGISDEKIKTMVPMRRLGRPEEVAKLVGFLAGDDAAYVTGQVIAISGGMA